MANVVYEDKFYNEEIKREFMKQYAEGTQKILSRIFKVSQVVESDLDKDLYNFNREELRKLFFLYMPKTIYSSRANVQWCSKYIDWAIENNYSKGLNPLETVNKEWEEQFVNKSIKKYWTKKEIDKIITSRKNAQDAVIVSLLWNGVRGTGNSELLNLTKIDVDAFNNKLHLYDDLEQKHRTIIVDDECIKLCQQALEESEYEKLNGNTSKDIKSPTTILIENEYILRSSKTKTEHLFEAEKNLVHRRLSNIADEIGEPNFASPMNIVYSGMLYYAAKLFQQNGKLDDAEYLIICEQFNVPMDQSLHRLKKEFLNLEKIKKLYDSNEILD